MSKADEMFEKIGYKKDIDNEYEIEYILPNDYYINFNKNFISIEKGQYNGEKNIYIARPLIKEELQAINEKCKELRMDLGGNYE